MIKMNSKFLVVSSLVMTMSATASYGKGLYKSGLYTGLSAGHSYMSTSVNEVLMVPAPVINTSGNGRAKKNGVTGDIFGGYRHFFNNGLLLGLDLNLSLDSNRIKQNFNLGGGIVSSTTLKSSFKVTPAVVIGKQFSDRWLGFVKLGVGISRFKGDHSIGIANNPASFTNDNISKTKAGFMGGIGLEYALNNKISTVATVGYENYGKITPSYKGPANVAGEKNNATLKPSYVTTKLSLVYKF